MDFLSLVMATLQRGVFGWMVVAGILTVFELINARDRIRLRTRVGGIAFWAASIPLSAVLVASFSYVMIMLDIRPIVTLPVLAAVAWAGPIATVIAVLIAAVVNDFFFYCYHRIQHRWLWRFHAVHHSISDLNAVNSYHHVSETIISLLLLTIPISLITSDVGPALPLASMILHLHVVWIHSPTRFNFGPLRAVFADNRFHRIHHSLEERHFDKNFGAFTTLWDRLFDTAYFPERDEWPAVGLAEVGQPENVREWLDLPNRYKVATKAADGPVASGQPAVA